MNSKRNKMVLLILAIGLFLSACANQPVEASTSQPTETVLPVTSTPTEPPPPTHTAVPTKTTVPMETTTPTESPTADPPAQTFNFSVSFEKDLLPILQSRCVNCHGGDRVEEGLILKTYADLMAGSKNGAVVTAGDAENSLLAEMVSTQKMPKRGPKLTPPQVQLIIDWINQGALDN